MPPFRPRCSSAVGAPRAGAPDIFADDAEHEQLGGTEDRDRRHDGTPARHRVLHESGSFERIDYQEEAEEDEAQREIDGEAQRPQAVRRDAGDGELHHAAQRSTFVAAAACRMPRG